MPSAYKNVCHRMKDEYCRRRHAWGYGGFCSLLPASDALQIAIILCSLLSDELIVYCCAEHSVQAWKLVLREERFSFRRES